MLEILWSVSALADERQNVDGKPQLVMQSSAKAKVEEENPFLLELWKIFLRFKVPQAASTKAASEQDDPIPT